MALGQRRQKGYEEVYVETGGEDSKVGAKGLQRGRGMLRREDGKRLSQSST